jgi:Peptidase family M23
LRRATVSVAERGHRGVAVGPIPGSTPSTEVYVPVEGRVYLINVYGEELGERGRRLLSSLRFYPPSRAVESLQLPAAEAPNAFRASEEASLPEPSAGAALASGESARVGAASGGGREARISEGCWRADPDFFVQTQHGMYSNRGWYPDGAARHSGWTRVGRPNFWGEYTHGSLKGYGRCTKPYNTNDKFAVDYPLEKGDAVFSPFRCGRVTFAGKNVTHQDYGIMVSIRACNGKYVSLSAHLSDLAAGIREGREVTGESVIGYAGATGGPNFPVGYPHLHQAFYRNPHCNPDGSPYGGAGLKVVYHNYLGTAAGKEAGLYQFAGNQTRRTVSKGSWISN